MPAARAKARKPATVKHPVDTEWFLERIAASARGSARQVALAMGLDPSALIRALYGERRLRIEEAQQLAHHLGVALSDVLTHAGIEDATGPAGVPVVGTVTGDGTVRASWSKLTTQRIPTPPDIPGDAVALAFATAGGELDHLDGAVLVCKRPGPPKADDLGRAVVAVLGDGSTVYGYLRRSRQRGRHSLLVGPGMAGARRMDDVVVGGVAPVLWLRMP
jgi:hypothetical protein